MRKTVRVLCEVLAAGGLACFSAGAQPADAPALQKSPITLPETLLLPSSLSVLPWGRIPVVVVSIDDSRVERAAIATGLNADVVLPDASQRLKLPAIAGKIRIAALDVTATAGQAEIAQFRAGTLDLKKLPVAVADIPGLLSLQSHPDAPATWLGTPFLSAFQVTLDPVTQNISLNKATTPLPHGRDISVVRLVMREGRPYVSVSIPGAKTFLALLDTTSPGTVIPTAIAEQLKLKPIRVESISRREGKPGKAAFVQLPKLSVGKAEWKGCRVVHLTSDSSKEYDRTFAVLGMDFISQFTVTIDYARLQIAFAPPKKPEVKPPDSLTP